MTAFTNLPHTRTRIRRRSPVGAHAAMRTPEILLWCPAKSRPGTTVVAPYATDGADAIWLDEFVPGESPVKIPQAGRLYFYVGNDTLIARIDAANRWDSTLMSIVIEPDLGPIPPSYFPFTQAWEAHDA